MAEVLIDLWLRDTDLGNAVAGLPWVADRVSEEEARVLHSLRNIADTDQELAKLVVELSWLADDVADNEWRALYSLGNIASKDIELAKMVAGFAWFADGFADEVPSTERLAIDALYHIAFYDTQLATLAVEFTWFSDGITGDEREALHALGLITSKDAALARQAANLSWFADGITSDEWEALYALGLITSKDAALARQAASLSWFADGITSDERDILSDLSSITSRDAALARDVIRSLLWFADGPERDLHSYVPRSLAGLARIGEDVLGQLTALPWFADGLDDAEAALVTTLYSVVGNIRVLYSDTAKIPEIYNDLLGVHYIQHKAISLPIAGQVNIWVIENTPPPPGEDLLTIIEDAARVAEGFLGVPFPTTDIILLVVPRGHGIRGAHYRTHMMLVRRGWDEMEVPFIPHETAHYYFDSHFGPKWFIEGGADFIQAYVNDQTGVEGLADRKAQVAQEAQSLCFESNRIENIRHLVYIRYDGEKCPYSMGEDFLLNVFDTIGEEAMASALSELYLQPVHVTEEDIYHAFLKHAPQDRKEAFHDLYRRMHGGAFAFPETDFSDAHGDEPSKASEIEVGEVVEGTLDYMFDFDYFRFRAEDGQRYRIGITHETLRLSSVVLYGADGQRAKGWQSKWEDRDRVPYGVQIRWTAPSSGEYYLAVQNFGGKSGPYTFSITPVATVSDDHSDSAAAATDISVGEIVEGAIDYDYDFDFFRFQVVAGQEYELTINYVTIPFCRVRMYESDGVTRTRQGATDSIGKDLVDSYHWPGNTLSIWVAPSSGVYYLVADGAFGSVGTYRLLVSEADS